MYDTVSFVVFNVAVILVIAVADEDAQL